MLLTVVGSGTLVPDAQRGSASFHIQAGSHSLLLDAGAGALHGLPRAGVDWRGIDTVAITHFHPDHVTDLPQLLAAVRFEGIERLSTLVGPPGLADFLDRLAALHGPWIHEPALRLTIVELQEGATWTSPDGAISLQSTATPHTNESVAYMVSAEGRDAGGARIGYTGDTGPSDEVADFLAGCDVLVAECALSDPPEVDTHLSPDSLAALAMRARPELLVVTHVYPPQRPAEAVEAIERGFDGRVLAATDGLRIEVGPDGVAVDRPSDRA